jgi:hypothetical protein
MSKVMPSLSLVISLLLLTACAKQEAPRQSSATSETKIAAADAAFVEQVTNTPSVDKINKSLEADQADLLQLASWGPGNDTERQALQTARDKITSVRAARDLAEREKQTALSAKNVYESKLQAYRQALAEAEAARKARAKATAALSAAQKEHDDAWAAVAAAREAQQRIVSEPKSTPEQKAAAEAAVAKASTRADQAAATLETRTQDLRAAQESNQSVLSSTVNSSAEVANRAGADYAAKANVATRALESLNFALSEEKKAMTVIHALNRERARVVTETLANAALDLSRATNAADSARAAAANSNAAKDSADKRLAGAERDAAQAQTAASAAAEASARAVYPTQLKAEAKKSADAVAALAASEYAAAKSTFDSANAVSSKSAAEAWRATKAVADATARVEKARQSANWATKVSEQKKSPEAQKSLETLQAALAKAEEELKIAQDALPALKAKAEADAAVTAATKAEADAKLRAHNQAASLAATAAKEKAQADASLAAAQRAAAAAAASEKARAAELEKARLAAASASSTAATANQKNQEAARRLTEARSHYERVYTKVEAYKLSPTRSEQEELSDEQRLYSAALWSKTPEGNYWTSLVISATREHLNKLEKARDINDWCPGYWQASEHQREVCWLRLFGGLVKFESSFKGDTKFHEGGGVWSIGLMALSPKECKGYETEELLKKPLFNLRCGIGKFANLVERDGYIDGPESGRGAAAYWSTLRQPYTKPRPNGDGHYKLGKKYEIKVFTTVFRDY